jgi:hypothetical protein
MEAKKVFDSMPDQKKTLKLNTAYINARRSLGMQ